MKSIKLALYILLILGINIPIKAQFYNTGQDRNSTKYKQINTESFRLVYPDFAEEKAQYFANKLKWASKNVSSDLSDHVRKINIIMYFESATSNAMVIWAPRRMEVHSTPDQASYAEDWFEQLALHEYRHVVQIDHLNQGLTKLIGYIFGESGTSVVLGAYLPLWYLEGDAVATETALSNTGRGRMADFAMPLRAQLLENGSYSYDKAYLGSYKDFVPDYYTLGYHLVTIGRGKYGKDFWKNTEDFVARNPYYIVPFSHSIYSQSGMRKNKFYKSCVSELEQKWKYELKSSRPDTLLKPQSRFYTSYRFGQKLSDNNLIVYKTGIGEIGKIVNVVLSTKDEFNIATTAYGNIYNIDVEDSNIFWVEKRRHPRWEKVNYKVVMRYDLRKNKKSQISHKSNYTFVVKNPVKDEISCIEINKKGENNIVIISLDSKKILKKYAINSQIKNLEYSTDGKELFFYKLNDKGFSINKLNIQTEEEATMIAPSFVYRNWISATDSSLLFISDSTGISNIYEYRFSNNSIQQLTNVKYGVGAISTDKKGIIYDDYSASGWQINYLHKDSIHQINNKIETPKFYNSYIIDTNRNIQKTNPPFSEFESKKYSKAAHLLNIHSWGPLAIHASNTEINPGLTISSQNILSNLDINMGYEYILNESVSKYFAEINYTALYPRISLVSSYQDRRSSYNNSNGLYYYTWNETSLGLQISQGIRLNKGAYSNYFRPLFEYSLQKIGKNDDTPTFIPVGKNIQSLRYGLYAYTYRKRSSLDINPRFGQNINLDIRHTPFGDMNYGYIVAFESNTYLPGIGKHHNLKIYFGYQEKQQYSSLAYSDIIRLPRGLDYINNDFYRNGRNTKLLSYQFNYQLPLLYPDLSAGSLVYIKRIKANLFADYAKSGDIIVENALGNYDIFHYLSYGADINFDMHVLRNIAPLDLGLRSGYSPDSGSYFFQFLFSVNL
jgi:hypothetical protein